MVSLFVWVRETDGGSVDKALHDVAIAVDAAVAEERPPATYLFAMAKVDTDHSTFLF